MLGTIIITVLATMLLMFAYMDVLINREADAAYRRGRTMGYNDAMATMLKRPSRAGRGDMPDRKTVLLKACLDLLKKQDRSHYVLNLLEETVRYDEADRDGYCLMMDINAELWAEG